MTPPEGLPPLPPIPKGYNRWIYQGIGYQNVEDFHTPFATTPISPHHEDFGEWFLSQDDECPAGDPEWHYIVAAFVLSLPEEDAKELGVDENGNVRPYIEGERKCGDCYNGMLLEPGESCDICQRHRPEKEDAKPEGERPFGPDYESSMKRYASKFREEVLKNREAQSELATLREENSRLREYMEHIRKERPDYTSPEVYVATIRSLAKRGLLPAAPESKGGGDS